MKNIILLFSMLLMLTYSNEVRSEVINSNMISRGLGIKPFVILHYLDIDHYVNKNLKVSDKTFIAVAGKFLDKRSKQTFVLVFSKNQNGRLKKEAIFEFYSPSIDYLKETNDKIYVVFKDQTELYGWFIVKNGRFEFIMFDDPEL